MSQTQPWERQDGETPIAFDAFRVYRDMGTSRSVRAVAHALDKSVQLIGRWSSVHGWVDRARAYDNHRDAEHLEATADKEDELLGRLLDSAEMLRHKAHTALAQTPIEDISPALAVRMLEAAAKILATRRGLKPDDTEHNATVDVVALANELMNRGNPRP